MVCEKGTKILKLSLTLQKVRFFFNLPPYLPLYLSLIPSSQLYRNTSCSLHTVKSPILFFWEASYCPLRKVFSCPVPSCSPLVFPFPYILLITCLEHSDSYFLVLHNKPVCIRFISPTSLLLSGLH